jgi:hypothetical protein
MQRPSFTTPTRWRHLPALLGFIALVAAMHWPLVAHLRTHVVGYVNGDTWEALFQLRWMARALFDLRVNPFVAPDVYYPLGWHLASGAQPPWYYAALAPLTRLLGEVVAWNLTTLLALTLAAWGAYALAHDHTHDRLAAFVAGCVYIAAPVITLRLRGHLHMLLGAMWLPWAAWAMLRSLSAGRRSAAYAALAGLLLGLAVISHWYFLYMASLPLAALWLTAAIRRRRDQALGRTLGLGLLTGAVAALVAAPWAWLTVLARRAMFPGGMAFDLLVSDPFSLSPDRLLLPNAFHPLLGAWIQRVRPLTGEHDVVGIGVTAAMLALVGLAAGRRQRASYAPLLAMLLTALVLAMGTTLHWANARVEVALPPTLPAALALPLSALNARLGVAVGRSAIPLPGLALAVWAPLYASIRVWGRYAIPLMAALSAVAAIGAAWLRRQGGRWASVAILLLAALVVAEGWVAPYIGAYDVNARDFPAVAVNARPRVNATLAALPPGTPLIEFPRDTADGLAMYAQGFHHQPVVNGYMSSPPDAMAQAPGVMDHWPTLAVLPTLRQWGVRYLVFNYAPEADYDQALAALLSWPDLALVTHLDEGFSLFTDNYIFRILDEQRPADSLEPLQVAGVYGLEPAPNGGTFRWTEPLATLTFAWPAAGMLELSLAGGRNEGVPPCHLTVEIEGVVAWEGELSRDFAPPRALLFAVEDFTNRGAPELEVTLRATPWRPTSKPDERTLGVMLYGARVRLGE